MELIELHILQSFPVTCLNRDDVGAPKSAFFGGIQRARVSSQSWKRAIRAMARELQPAVFAGTRTRYVIRDLKRRFANAGRSPQEAQELAEATADALGKLDSVEKGTVKTLLYFSPMEMENVVQAVLGAEFAEPLGRALEGASVLQEATVAKDDKAADKARKGREKTRNELVKICEKPAKELRKAVKDAADIAVFGRMVADDHTLTIEGAGLFSHALSTHQAANEVEFFSAVDDTPDVEEQGAGAGHIGTLEFNSACYYRYVGLNLDLLRDGDHLTHLSEKEFRTVLDTFLRSALLAVPGARKNSMFGFNPPAFVLGLRRRGHPLSLVNAFEEPIKARGEGYIKPSIERLESHLRALREAYALPADVEERIPPKPKPPAGAEGKAPKADIDALVEALLGPSGRAEV
jgi:CRISPR system Cascade subunit CasC